MSRRSTAMRSVAATAAVLTALVLTACGGGDDHAPVRNADSAPPSAAAPAPPPDPAPPASGPPTSSAPPAKVNKVTIQPSRGQTVGIGMPVSLTFDFPVKGKDAKAAVEKALTVTTTPAVEGSWGWVTDQLGYDRVDWRPKSYWAPGTKVTLDAKLNGVSTGDDRFFVRDYSTEFTIGTARVSTVDVAAKTLTVTEGGSAVKTLHISAGSPENATYNGTMVVLEKQKKVHMDSETVGLGDAYNKDVFWDVRLTTSGTFAHAAPWNAALMGKTNASHGCIGMSDDDARWFYDRSVLGDVVEVAGSTGRTVDVGNGFGDWNLGYPAWQARSALPPAH